MYEKFYPSVHTPQAPRFFLPWMTLLLIASTIFVFFQQIYGMTSNGEDMVADTYDFSPEKLNGPAWWTVFTYAWIHLAHVPDSPHIYLAHIVSNLIVFICVGPALEELLGHFSFLVLYLGGAASSALVWMVFSGGPAVDPHLMGASGAIFAVIAGLGAAGGGHKVLTFMFVLPFRMRADVLAVLAFIFEIIALPSRSPVAHTAHLGGAAFGFLYILIFHYILGRPRTEF